MQFQNLYLLALAGFGAATKSCVTGATSVPHATSLPHATSDPTSTPTGFVTSVCADFQEPCGNPPTATLWYGGCYDLATPTTFTPPACPTGGSSAGSCTKTGTVCDDRFKSCGDPVSTVLTYGACHDACVTLTYSEPACPIPTYTAA